MDAADADAMGNEPVFDRERVIGITTSGAYGPTVRRSLAFAYVESAYAEPGTSFEVGILGERRPATVQAEPLYDPRNERLRAEFVRVHEAVFLQEVPHVSKACRPRRGRFRYQCPR